MQASDAAHAMAHRVLADSAAEVKAAVDRHPDSERHVREDLRSYGASSNGQIGPVGVDLAIERSTPLIIDGLYSYAALIYLQEQRRSAPGYRHPFRFAKRASVGATPVRPLTPAEIRERDRTEVESIDKAPPIALADYHFVNDGELGQLNDFADSIVVKTR